MRRGPVVVLGAGAAGLGLAVRLAEQGRQDVVLVSSPTPPPERTWCSWQRHDVPWAAAVAHRWPRAEVAGPDGGVVPLDLAPYRYEMVRSRDFERWAQARLHGVEQVAADVDRVEDGPEHAVVHAGARRLRAQWVFDTRPAAPSGPGTVALLQHFRGWFVRTSADAFDPGVARLMDLRTEQPRGGVAFGYVLPVSPREALVEHTVFSRERLPDAAYDAALRRWTADLPPFDVERVEDGVIPMTDAPFERRVGRRVFRLGAAGGATRPSTGYTFTAAQRQAATVAVALLRGDTVPMPMPAYPWRHRAMDAVLLRALDRGRLDGARFLHDLFARHPAPRVLRFLDGDSGPREELRVMASAPVWPMLRSLR